MSTIFNITRLPTRRQQGVAAVEFAVLLPVLLILLTFPIFFGRVFMHYSAINKAAHDAAIYYSTIPVVEMGDTNKSYETMQVAESIISMETSELRLGGGGRPRVVITCDDRACGNFTPLSITVNVNVKMFDDYFNDFTWLAVGPDGVLLNATVTIPYVGN